MNRLVGASSYLGGALVVLGLLDNCIYDGKSLRSMIGRAFEAIEEFFLQENDCFISPENGELILQVALLVVLHHIR
jgi:hypothetical protein